MQTMNKKQIITILLCLFCAISFAQTTPSYTVKTVVIDAGHGGKDPGACGKISKEKNITLAIALKVGSLISGGCQDVKVIYTRNTDEFIELHKRADIANKAKADLFISIHVNANPNPEAYGTDTWTMGLAKNEANLKVAKMENDVISLETDATQYQGMSANDNEAIILYRLQQGAFCDNSLALAGMVQKQLQSLGRKDRSVHQAPFLVLWKTAMPSILIETGFITNPEEEIWLNSPENQSEMAYSIYQAFLEYKQYIERRTNGQIEKTTETKDVVKKQEPTSKPQQHIEKQPVQQAEKTQQKTAETQTIQINALYDIFYGIQIGAGSEKLSSSPSNFNGLEGVYYIEENGLYKYYYGKTKTYSEISELLKIAKEKYPSAFIVARDGKNNKLQVSEARKQTN